MTADEIRSWSKELTNATAIGNQYFVAATQAQAVLEVAAQLAQINEHLSEIIARDTFGR